MKPQSYLTKEGERIFNELVTHLQSVGLHDADSYKLSALANAFDLHAVASEDLNKNGYSQETKTNYSQVKAEFTLWKTSLDMINKLSPVFGIDPANREKILAFTNKKTPLEKFE